MKKVMLVFLCFLLAFTYIPLGGGLEVKAAELPENWETIAYNGAGGSISYDPATVTYTINASGNGIRNQVASNEQFQYVYTEVSGDFTIIAKMVDMENKDQAQAGILVRGSLSQGSPFVYSYLYGTEGLYQPTITVKPVTQEASVGNSGYSTKYSWEDVPKYLRVRKQWNAKQNRTDVYFDMGVLEGTTIKWTNINGKNITEPGITSESELLVGLAVGKDVTAKFSNVTLTNAFTNAMETPVSDLVQPPAGGHDPEEDEPIDDTPPVLTGVTAFPMDSAVQLSWQTVTGDVYYHIKRSTVSGGPYTEIAKLHGIANQITDTGLSNNTTYYYVLSVEKNGVEGAHSAEVSATPRKFIINDNYENYTLGDIPPGYSSLQEQRATNNLAVVNTRDENSRKTKWYGQDPANNYFANKIEGNSTNVLWVNDKDTSRGSYVVDIEPITGGFTVQLDFMQPNVLNDTYVLELMDSTKAGVYLHLRSLPTGVTIAKNTWYTVKFVVDVQAHTADLYINGQYYGNKEFDNSTLTQINRIQGRMPGTSTGDMFIDNLILYKHVSTTPQNLAAEGANHRAILTWNAASGVDSYNVYRSDSPGGPYKLVASGVKENQYTDTDGLENDRYYYYVVTSVNAQGESDYSNEAAAFPNDVPPPSDPIQNFSAIVRDGQLTLVWDDVPGATYYTLERATSVNGPYFTLKQNGSEHITGTSYLDTNLWNGTEYYYRLTAGNIGGLGSTAITSGVPARPLQAPVLISADSGDGLVHLTWTPVNGADKYIVSRSEANGGPYTELMEVKGTSYVDATSEAGKTYYYVVVAVSGAQKSMISNQLKAKPYVAVAGAPAKVEGLWAEADSGSVTLMWKPANGAVQYQVKRSTTSGGPYTTIAPTGGTSYVDTNVTNGTTYYYVVSAVNASGEGADSDEITVLPAKILRVDANAAADHVTVFNTIQAAVDSVPANNTERVIIHIAPGEYKEKLVIKKPYISLVGSGMDATKITWGDYAGTSATVGQPGYQGNTFLTQTVEVDADYFSAANLTIENSAGPRVLVQQAIALSIKSNQAAFESVRLIGHQDTLYNGLRNNGGQHYFHNSIIEGDVDFIFGEAPAVVMNNVRLVLVSEEGASGGHITAGAQRNIEDRGYVFFNSHIVDDGTAKGIYDLGRPWKDYARISFINTNIDSDTFLYSGWIASCAGSCKDKYFFEYNSYGPGANAWGRDISTNLTGEEASLTIPQILGGWDPSVPVIMPRVQYMPEVVTTYARFDKNPLYQDDVHVIVNGYGQELKSINNGGQTLASSDYEVRGNVYSIKRQYLAQQPEGRLNLTFVFANAAVELTVHITDTSDMDIGRQVLNVQDGWAAYSSDASNGTTGGATAAPSQVYVVENRSELLAALGGANNSTPKIIYIKGTIDMNVDDNNNPVGIEYYMDPKYDFEAYLETYHPDVWGRDKLPSGELEQARANSQKNQGDRIKIPVGSNTTIVGLPGTDATIRGGNLVIQNVSNVIVRNIRFENTFDYFPQWDPTDGPDGNWNSEYDAISIKNATNVWIDHNTFTDGGRQGYDYYYGRKYQMYDGFLDITNSADLVTVSYNVFENHDKVTLVGGSDMSPGDEGKLRVTFHHNYYKNVGQRVPRVRYGQVHVFNNYYEGSYSASDPYLYSIGVGYKSQVYAENNYFVMDPETQVSALIQINNGDSFTDQGSVLNGRDVSIIAEHPTLKPVEWRPILYNHIDDTRDVPAIVLAQAGADSTEHRDTRAPMWLDQAELTVSNLRSDRVVLTWPHAYDNIGVAGYGVYLMNGTDAELIAELDRNTTTYTVANLSANTEYTFMIQAVDAAGNWSVSGPQVTVRTPSAGSGTVITTPPTAPVQNEVTGSLAKAAQVTGIGGAKVVTLDAEAVSELVSGADEDTMEYTLHVANGEGEVQVRLTAEVLGIIAEHQADAVLQIETDQGSFHLPVGLLDLSQLAQEAGVTVHDLTVTVTISEAEDDLAAAFRQAVIEQGATPLTAPVVFTLTLDEGDGQVREIEQFTTYVARVIKLESEVNASTAVGVMYDPASNAITPVPTVFNGSEAVLMRPGNSLYAVIEHSKTFADLSGHWSRSDVELMASKFIVRGVTDQRFAPDQSITRAEFAALLVRALGLPEKATDAFRDVTHRDWFSGAVGAALEAGLVTGFPDGSFRPHEKITREQMAAMVVRALLFAGHDVAADPSVLDRYADAGGVSPWAVAPLTQAVSEGIITGTSTTTLSPQALATRAEAVVMVKRLMQVLNFIDS